MRQRSLTWVNRGSIRGTGGARFGDVGAGLDGDRPGRRPNPYRAARLGFGRRWLGDETLSNREVVTVELYPWHSERVTAAIRPPEDVLAGFVWEPLGELGVELAFPFGRPWVDTAVRLGLKRAERWPPGERH